MVVLVIQLANFLCGLIDVEGEPVIAGHCKASFARIGPITATRAKTPNSLRGNCTCHRKSDSATVESETRAKNLLKRELKRKGITYAQLAEKLAAIGVVENERNLNDKVSRGGFTAAFLLQWLAAAGVASATVSDAEGPQRARHVYSYCGIAWG